MHWLRPCFWVARRPFRRHAHNISLHERGAWFDRLTMMEVVTGREVVAGGEP